MKPILFASFILTLLSITSLAVPVPSFSFSSRDNVGDILKNIDALQGLQGHDDENWPKSLLAPDGGPTPILLARYAALAPMKPGIRRYNMFWSEFESVVPSSATTQPCPTGTVQMPGDEAQRAALGFHRYHCYNNVTLTGFDTILGLDKSIGAQAAAILYSAPAWARRENCTGFKFGNDTIKGGCVPADGTARDDYEDFVNMLSWRYSPMSPSSPSSRTAGGGDFALNHLIVWNEVASAAWMDCSPLLPNRADAQGGNPMTEAQMHAWVNTYADLVTRTHRASRRHSTGTMIWTSNDRNWERPKQAPGEPLHIGVRPFLDRLWPMLGSNLTWALAVHPYDGGDPRDKSEFEPFHHPQAYTFATLDKVVKYQRKQLRDITGIDPDSDAGRPFSLLYASEQGWPFPACCADPIRGRNICNAQKLSSELKEMIAVTHNYFQDSPGGSEQGGQDYGLIPGNVTADLSNGRGDPTFDAYNSTASSVWGLSDDHYCCQQWKVGCM